MTNEFMKVHPIEGSICVDCGRDASTIQREYIFPIADIAENLRGLNGSWRSNHQVYVRCCEMAAREVMES